MKPSFIFSSNSVQLSVKDWIVVGAILLSILHFLPRWMDPGLAKLSPLPAGYRLPHILSDDYWMFNQWSRYASLRYPVLILGDSVIWGHYVKMEDTLSEYLNEQVGKRIFANLGLKGLHPVAKLGLIRYHGEDIRERSIILHLNLLWMSSKKIDLRGEEKFRFNHPQLVPQLFPNLGAYDPSFSEIIGVIAKRHIPFFSWVKHLRITRLEMMDLPKWVMLNPYKNPFRIDVSEMFLPEDRPVGRPISWTERGIKRQDFPWVKGEESFQLASFGRLIEILEARNNKVFVLLGPLNSHLLTEESLKRYNVMNDEVAAWLEERGISFHSASVLPSELYADASHPLKEGYALMAEELLENESFQGWLKLKKVGVK